MDAGNFSLPFGKEAAVKNEFLVRAFVAMGYCAINLGKADLRHGARLVTALREKYHVPFVSTNLVYAETNEPIVDTHRIRTVEAERGNLSIGILGVCPTQTRLFPKSLAEPAVSALDPKKAVAREIEVIRSKCDLVLLLSQLSYKENMELVEQIQGVDMVIGAGDSVRVITSGGKSWAVVATPGFGGKYLGYFTIKYTSGSMRVVDQGFIPLDDSVGEDPVLRALEEEFEEARH